MSNTHLRKPIEIKISTVVAISVVLHQAELDILNAALERMTGGVPDYFDNEFAVVDVGPLMASTATFVVDWGALIALLRSYRINPVAVRNYPPEMEPEIIAHGLSLDVVLPSRPETPSPVAVESAPPAAAGTSNALIVDTPVRAGQRIYAQGSDLIVTAAVNNGAELIADGSIHIYAPLRGRALAGANGNSQARIFTLNMEAELVSIAGIYRTFEDQLPKEIAQRPAQIRLINESIEVTAMALSVR